MTTCLIIDDSPAIRNVARVIIESLGFEVRVAEHGRQGFELCILQMPDVILLDWQLPVMSAHKFLKALAAHGPSRWPFIFYCTTELDFMDLREARAAGAADIIVKPFDRATLVDKLARFGNVLAMRTLALTPPDQPWPKEALDGLVASIRVS